MKPANFLPLILFSAVIAVTSCKSKSTNMDNTVTAPVLKEEMVSYTGDSITMNGFVAYDESIKGKRPAVLVIHEWWGLNDYIKMRVRELAKLGYLAMAVDMYGDGKFAENVDSATKWSTPFYSNPAMAKTRFDAALEKLKTYEQFDATRVAAMGYCFGGAQALSIAKLGEGLNGVVSFHGNLNIVPPSSNLKADVLICHGAADPFVPAAEVETFKKQMDSVGAKYTFKAYPDAVHAFTNPGATALGEKFKIPIKYNAAADTASWKDMREFFDKIFK